jgi:NtrC-family two-component system response regulator AlgB
MKWVICLLNFSQNFCGSFRITSCERVGDPVTRKADVRVIAATSVNLQTAVEIGTFRQELYYRMNVFEITIPPLRKRKEDIRAMANHFLNFFSVQNHRKIAGFSSESLEALRAHNWPGNVRELRNVNRTRRDTLSWSDDRDHLPESFKSVRRAVNIGEAIPITAVEEAHIRRRTCENEIVGRSCEDIGH